MKVLLPAAIVLLLASCASPHTVPKDKRWTLPLKQLEKTVDLLTGNVKAENEQVFRYDEQDRITFHSLSTDGVRTHLMDTALYKGWEQSYYQTSSTLDTLWVRALYADKSPHRTLFKELVYRNQGQTDTLRAEYSYDELDRLTGFTTRVGSRLVEVYRDYTYGERTLSYSRIQYDDGEVYLNQRIEIDYADDKWSLPACERTWSRTKWGTEPELATCIYSYDRRGRVISWKLWNGEPSGKPDEMFSNYRYRDKRLTYVKTELAGGKPIRETKVAIEYKY